MTKIIFPILQTSTQYPKWCLDYTVSSVKFLRPRDDVIIVDHLEPYLKNSNADYAFIQSPGHCIDVRLFETRFLNSNLKDNLVIGHILLNNENCPWFHPQCFILNLNQWKMLNCPDIGIASDNFVDFPNFTSSIEMFHDDYTPHKIFLNNDFSKRKSNRFGWNIIKHQLLFHKQAIAFPNFLRFCKQNVYTHSSVSYDLSATHIRHHYENIKNIQVYHFSNDDIPIINDVDHIITQSSGFKFLKFLKNALLCNKITIYDCSEKSLIWQRFLKQNWNGVDYLKFSNLNLNNIVGSNIKNFPKLELTTFEEQWINLLNYFGGQNKFQTYWKMYSNMNVNFIHADILTYDRQKILDTIMKNEKIVFDLSNIFNMPINIFGRTFECMNEHIQDIKNKVDKITKNVNYLGIDVDGNSI